MRDESLAAEVVRDHCDGPTWPEAQTFGPIPAAMEAKGQPWPVPNFASGPPVKATDRQEGGSHYKDFPIQPGVFCQTNRLPFWESSIIKRMCRHKSKGGKQDLLKAIHEIQLIIEMEYPDVLKLEKDPINEYVSIPPEHCWPKCEPKKL